jgi:hypothetical protein
MDSNKEFDREVWQNVFKARGALETAMLAAERLGYDELAYEINVERHRVLLLLASCHSVSENIPPVIIPWNT